MIIVGNKVVNEWEIVGGILLGMLIINFGLLFKWVKILVERIVIINVKKRLVDLRLLVFVMLFVFGVIVLIVKKVVIEIIVEESGFLL